MLGFLVAVNIPTFRYFQIPDGFTEIDIHDPSVQEAFEYGKETASHFHDDFVGPHPISLVHAWKRTTDESDFYAVEVLRLRLKYLIIVENPKAEEGKHYIDEIRPMNEELESGAHYFEPTDEVIELSQQAAIEKYGESAKVKKTIFYRTVMMGKTIGRHAVSVSVDNQIHLIVVTIVKQFGEKQFKTESVEEVY